MARDADHNRHHLQRYHVQHILGSQAPPDSLHVCGVFAIVVPLWVMGPRAPARTALLDYQNLGGWDSMGLAALIGMVTPLNVLIGYDCSVHMCKY
jgi:hypothetical protein